MHNQPQCEMSNNIYHISGNLENDHSVPPLHETTVTLNLYSSLSFPAILVWIEFIEQTSLHEFHSFLLWSVVVCRRFSTPTSHGVCTCGSLLWRCELLLWSHHRFSQLSVSDAAPSYRLQPRRSRAYLRFDERRCFVGGKAGDFFSWRGRMPFSWMPSWPAFFSTVKALSWAAGFIGSTEISLCPIGLCFGDCELGGNLCFSNSAPPPRYNVK